METDANTVNARVPQRRDEQMCKGRDIRKEKEMETKILDSKMRRSKLRGREAEKRLGGEMR